MGFERILDSEFKVFQMVWGKLGIWFWLIAILGFWATVKGNWRFSEGVLGMEFGQKGCWFRSFCIAGTMWG